MYFFYNSQRKSSYGLQPPNVFKHFLNCPPNGPHKTTLEIFKFEFLIFNNLFSKISNSRLYPMGKPKTSIIWKTSHRRAKRSEIWHSWGYFNIYEVL